MIKFTVFSNQSQQLFNLNYRVTFIAQVENSNYITEPAGLCQ
ncbi:hypothetical protein WVIC16_10012 [Weissella viridescens]|nr:hypothetical protein WVIC16_10012 [Weissella viridescens]